MKKSLTAVLAMAGATAVAVPAALAAPTAPTASASKVVSCHKLVYPGGPVFVTSARNMTCRGAKREQRRYEWTGDNRFTTPGGYRCRPSGRGAVGFQIRCVKGKRAYRIEFED